MMRLTGRFEVDLPGQCLAAWPEGEEIRSDCKIGEFEITLKLIRDSYGRIQEAGAENWTYVLEKAIVEVSKHEPVGPPLVIPGEKGQLDYTIQAEYFSDRIGDYGVVACEAVNRVIRFFKFRLNTPSLKEFPKEHHYFRNAKWIDSQGEVVGKGPFVSVVKAIPGLRGQLRIQKLTPDLAELLRAALGEPICVQLHEEIISDAQTALCDGSLRRAVLELAMGTEIAVKRTFFAGGSPAGAAFDYLEDKAQIRVTILDLIDRVAQEAFGQSFKTDLPEDYRNIDNLFRCRNKVAHRGELSYRDDRGVRKAVDYAMVAAWWKSVNNLMAWLGGANAQRENGN